MLVGRSGRSGLRGRMETGQNSILVLNVLIMDKLSSNNMDEEARDTGLRDKDARGEDVREPNADAAAQAEAYAAAADAAGAAADGSGEALREAVGGEYKYGFVSDIDTDIIPQGLNADVVRLISQKKGEPDWLLDFRLRAYEHWRTLTPPKWGHLQMPDIDFQALSYYAAPRRKSDAPKSLEEVDPAILDTFNRLGISLDEQKALSGMAVDAVMDSVSVKTTHKEKLAEMGIIFCSFSQAVRDYPDLVRRYLGKVVPYTDNFTRRSTVRCSPMGRLCISPRGCAARWSCLRTSVSMLRARASLSVRSSWPTTTRM